MFGRDDDNTTSSDSTATLPEPVSDGTLAGANEGHTSQTISPTTHTAPAVDSTTSTTQTPSSVGATSSTVGAGPSLDHLLSIKQDALKALSPLVGHLDQTPEEKFRTMMMMIQASDNQSLIKDAYEAAQKIEDEKTRAQALLDVVNEINYFSQQQNKEN